MALALASCSSSANSSGSKKNGSTSGTNQDGGNASGGGSAGTGTSSGQGSAKDGGGTSTTGNKDGGGTSTTGNKDGGGTSATGNKDGGSTGTQDGGTKDSGPSCQKTGLDDDCNGKDDDCDGKTDEDYVGHATSCGKGVCAAQGLSSCVSGAEQDNCTPHDPLASTDTTCNGVDDDCDGNKDEDYVPDASCGLGPCQANNTPSSCNAGIETLCQPGRGANDDALCNGVDDDCDGTVDEEYVASVTHCGVGACSVNTGMRTCMNGAPHDSCDPSAGAATDDPTCNGIDDDCDGHSDEEYAPVVTACGTGYCVSAGMTSCVSGHVSDSCSAKAPLSSNDTTCDGVDDDCDGTADEEYAPHGTTCGVGYCQKTGSTSCSGGHESDSCTPGSKLSNTDATCDGVDDNCNGSKDEDYVSVATSCGVGTCASTGATSCVSGHVADSCVPTTGFTTDPTCNNFDDDCDGNVDEEYSPNASCGTGYCKTTNTPSSCSGGVETACAPGAPLSLTDATCDGVDDNCNGAADEGYVSLPTSCGVGACASTGSTSCVNASVVDSCKAGTAATADATCDGKDDDCDGKTDEDYLGCFDGSTIGSCQNGHVVGVFSCNDGYACTTDSCIAATGSCDFAPSNAACPDDGYSCTHELCVANTQAGTDQTTGCARVSIDVGCPDNSFCNGSEVCDPARSGQPAGNGATGCASALPQNVPCNPSDNLDGVACTDTKCAEDGKDAQGVVIGHCYSQANDANCTNGHYCDGAETCKPGDPAADAGGCVLGSAPCPAVAACALSVCTETGYDTGTCSAAVNPVYSCGDSNPCTTDACDTSASPSSTGCTHTTVVGCQGCSVQTDCADAYNCTVDTCQGDKTCAHDSSACECFTNADCDDGKACTTDTCDTNGKCVHAPSDAYCVSQDLGNGGVCNGADTCNPASGSANAQGCVHVNAPLDCNDGLSCTSDSCDATLGCQHAPDNGICAILDTTKCDGTATCVVGSDPTATSGTGCVNPTGAVVCPDDGFACTHEVCLEVPSGDPGVPSTTRCVVQPDTDYCIAQPGGCGSTCVVGQGCVKTCNVATCQGKTYQCGDCIDNDGDCRIDTGADPDCLGPCSNNEAGFHGDIPGQNNSPCKMDCYFDQDTGAGNDDCYWDHSCDPLEVAPNYYPDGSKCAYDPKTNIAGTNKTCAQLMATNPPGQSTTCWEAGAVPIGNSGPNYCGILVPNGCDCFGCCTVPGVNYAIYLGSEDGSGNGSCTLQTLADQTKCHPCTQVPSCLNGCDHCELCVGKTTLPDDCACQLCPAGEQLCGAPCGTPCPAGFFCNTGCCAPVPQ